MVVTCCTIKKGQHVRVVVVLFALLITGCVSSGPASGPPVIGFTENPTLSGKYSGADAGYLIMSLAARKGIRFNGYSILFRKADRSADGAVWWGQDSPYDQRKLDINDSNETGVVDVRRLPPGDYEIFNYDIDWVGGLGRRNWKSKQDFSIPFTIKSGQATYVGEFMAAPVEQHGLLPSMPADDELYFVLANKADRDIAIAKQKEASINEVSGADVTPSTIGYKGIVLAAPR
jgi:hypothetical protein